MKKLIVILILSCAFSTAQADILFYDDAENVWTESEWLTSGTGDGNLITVSNEQKYGGSYSYKFYLESCASGPPCQGGAASNVELILRGLNSPIQIKNFVYGQEYWLGWAVFVPADFNFPDSDDNLGLMGQWHGTTDTRCDSQIKPPNMLFALDRLNKAWEWSVQGDDSVCDLTPDQTSHKDFSDSAAFAMHMGAWNIFVMNVIFDYDASAFTKVWINGTQVVNETGWNCYNDEKGPYWKLGLYGHFDVNTVVYYDEIRIGDQNSSYNEVVPKGEIYLPPTVSITPSAEQEIQVGGTVDYSCTATPVAPATIVSYLWTFADSGVADDTVADPAAKRFWIEGTYEVRVTVTDSNGLTATATSTVIVGSGAITGRTNNWLMESGAITTDADGNEDLINNGAIEVEPGGGTEMNPPGFGTHGVVLNGKDQYFSAAYWSSANPWQTGQPAGTFVIGIKTPAADPAATKYLGGKYDVDGQRTVSFFLSSSGMRPTINIGISNGTSFETKYLGTHLSTSTRYILFFSVDATAKTWAIRAYNAETTQWLPSATGSFSGTMNLAGNAPWNIGRRSDGAGYYAGKIYFAQLYNTVLSQGECKQLVSGAPVDPNR